MKLAAPIESGRVRGAVPANLETLKHLLEGRRRGSGSPFRAPKAFEECRAGSASFIGHQGELDHRDLTDSYSR